MAALGAVIFVALLSVPIPGRAEMYKYQKDGVWYYTDTPPKEMVDKSQTMTESNPRAAAPSLEGTPLLTNYTARNDIEKAAAATVAVKSSLGFGSGFFISPDGFIVTNKHVVRTTAQQTGETEEQIKRVEGRIEDIDRQFEDERRRLQEFKSRLDQFKKEMEAEADPNRRKSDQQEYDANLKRYEQWQRDYERRLSTYEKQKKTFSDGRADYGYRKSVGNLSQTFTIILADNTELYARLVVISTNHDLALLKIDGYQTPFLTPGNTQQLAQSNPVYAIGNPAKLQNSVSSGVFSGFQNGFLQTNAQIYPGNSGGPLVDDKGQVLGVNTFKQITYKFEGLGFAIPIDVVLKEFGAQLPGK
ncbi:MAG: trypsin-like peptidase domain-containing protein [Desulfobacteraceae bacterium]|nr:trypsin-like peptidase domain-containing protein [Desulfobacteraceae bacterium]